MGCQGIVPGYQWKYKMAFEAWKSLQGSHESCHDCFCKRLYLLTKSRLALVLVMDVDGRFTFCVSAATTIANIWSSEPASKV